MPTGIVLAGRRNRGALRAAAPDHEWEALVPLAGRPMGQYVVDALADVVDRIVVAGPKELVPTNGLWAEAGDDLLATLRAAVAAVPHGERELLLAAADAPLLTAASLRELLAAARMRGLGFGYPIVRRSACEAAFPGVRRTYVRLREGVFTGGNCLYVACEALPSLLGFAERVFAARKRPLQLARLLGGGMVVALLLGRARLDMAERVGTRLLGVPAGAVCSTDPGIGVDVDKPDDLVLCRRVLEARAGVQG